MQTHPRLQYLPKFKPMLKQECGRKNKFLFIIYKGFANDIEVLVSNKFERVKWWISNIRDQNIKQAKGWRYVSSIFYLLFFKKAVTLFLRGISVYRIYKSIFGLLPL